MKAILCVGLSHRDAPISIREQLTVPEGDYPARLLALKAIPGVVEALLLSTCNRLEVWAIANTTSVADDLVRSLGPLAAPHARVFEGDAAVQHLLRVAASLDSMAVGEAQILGQVREAAARAKEHHASGPLLERILMRAIEGARRVRTETAIARGSVSLSSVAVELAAKVLGDLRGRSAMLLGAGEMGQLAARELKAAGVQELLVVNRGAQRAEDLAHEVGGVPASLEDLPRLLERIDVALCAATAPQALITYERMQLAAKARRYRPLFLIDLSMPRNVEPRVNELENVYVYDLDDLEKAAADNRELREGEVEQAEVILRDAFAGLQAELRERSHVPVLGRLRQRAQAIADAEAERALSALAAHGTVDERQQKSIRAMASAIVNKLLHGPTQRLRAEAGAGPLAEAAAQLFDLQDPIEQVLPGVERPQTDPAGTSGQGA